jgi:4-diphosphocytidyl-2-C-methyl-D-erythritol kinase
VTAAPDRLTPVVRLAPAKLNLTLAVAGRRADGFHALHSIMVPLELADRLSLAPSGDGHDTLHVVAPDGRTGLDPADYDSVLRAVAEARREVGRAVETFGLAARLEKRIPVAAGLAGGSSDAAAAVDGALEAWGAELDDSERLAIASRLGSDVPFFLARAAALVEGRGERISPLRGIVGASPGVLLVTPPIGSSTTAAFAAHDGGGTAAPADPRSSRTTSEHLAAELRSGLRATDLVARAGVLSMANDLAPAAEALVAGLRPFRRALSRLLGRPVGLSGSGPTLWALYPSLATVEAAAAAVRDALAAGQLVAPGTGRAFVEPTTIQPSTGSEP